MKQSPVLGERWVEELWELAEKHAHSLDVSDVIGLLRETSEVVWNAGIDARFAAVPAQEGSLAEREKAAAFDTTWLAILLAKLTVAPQTRSV